MSCGPPILGRMGEKRFGERLGREGDGGGLHQAYRDASGAGRQDYPTQREERSEASLMGEVTK